MRTRELGFLPLLVDGRVPQAAGLNGGIDKSCGCGSRDIDVRLSTERSHIWVTWMIWKDGLFGFAQVTYSLVEGWTGVASGGESSIKRVSRCKHFVNGSRGWKCGRRKSSWRDQGIMLLFWKLRAILSNSLIVAKGSNGSFFLATTALTAIVSPTFHTLFLLPLQPHHSFFARYNGCCD